MPWISAIGLSVSSFNLIGRHFLIFHWSEWFNYLMNKGAWVPSQPEQKFSFNLDSSHQLLTLVACHKYDPGKQTGLTRMTYAPAQVAITQHHLCLFAVNPFPPIYFHTHNRPTSST